MPSPRVDVDALLEGVRAGRRASVSRAITLVESSRPEHRVAARQLLTALVDGTSYGPGGEARPRVIEVDSCSNPSRPR